MAILRRLASILFALVLAAVAAAPITALAARQGDGFVYVNLNTVGQNSVAGFARNADGSLTALPGSPFAVGGAGTGTPIGTQGALQLSGDGRYLLVADAASDQLSVLRLKPDGSLQPVEGSPFPANGSSPASIAARGDLVYVANIGAGGANYTGFTLNDGGHLRPIADSTIALPDNASVGNIAFDPSGSQLIGTRKGTTQIDSFTVGADGLLHAAPGSPFAGTTGTFAAAFRPTNPAQVFVANTAGGSPGPSSLSAYSVGANGALAPIGGPVGNGQRGSCWITVTPDGAYAFTSNAGSDTISRYALAASGAATLLGSTTLHAAPPDLHPFDLSVDPSGHFLYVNEVDSLTVGVLSINPDGSLTELAGSPIALPAGSAPFGLAIAPRIGTR